MVYRICSGCLESGVSIPISSPRRFLKAHPILHKIMLCKKCFPPCLIISGTCFTWMTIVGIMKEKWGQIPIHLDMLDAMSDLFHVGKFNAWGLKTY